MSVVNKNISILEYFNRLQLEYKLYEVRLKIYPFNQHKKNFKEILLFKKTKIEDIGKKNSLDSIFDSKEKDEEINSKFLSEFGVPNSLTKKDKYFYYFPGSFFSFRGKDCTIVSYDFSENIAKIKLKDQELDVDLREIRRII